MYMQPPRLYYRYFCTAYIRESGSRMFTLFWRTHHRFEEQRTHVKLSYIFTTNIFVTSTRLSHHQLWVAQKLFLKCWMRHLMMQGYEDLAIKTKSNLYYIFIHTFGTGRSWWSWLHSHRCRICSYYFCISWTSR